MLVHDYNQERDEGSGAKPNNQEAKTMLTARAQGQVYAQVQRAARS